MQKFQAKRMLVTGGCGFIGSNFIHYILKQYPQLTLVNLDALTYAGSEANLESLSADFDYHFVKGDIADEKCVNAILRNYEIDTIVHFAAESHVDRSISGPGAFVHSNVVGTFVLLEAARQYWLHEKKWQQNQCVFYHISTDEVFGTLTAVDPAFTETTPYAPNSPYSASKAGSDHLVRAYFHTYGLPIIMSNCSNNYGPRQHNEKFIPTVIRSCLKEKSIPIYGDGSNIRDWLYVEDHCSAIQCLLEKGVRGESYNIGGNQEMANIQVVDAICVSLDCLKPRDKSSYLELKSFVTDRLGHDWRYAINAAKMMALGWHPNETFQSGLQKTIDFYLKRYDQI